MGLGVIGETSGLWVHASPVEDGELSEEAEATATELRAALRALFQALGGRRLTEVLRGVDEPAALADLAGWWPDLALERKVELLETLDVGERLTLVLGWVKEALAEHELAEKIRNDVSEGLEGRQREFLLRQQMEAIRKELGEDGDEDSVAGYRERLIALVEAGAVPEATRKAIEREIDASNAPRRRTPSTAGSATGWTRCSSSRGASAAWTTTTSPRPARSSTRTTPGWTRSRTASSRCWPSQAPAERAATHGRGAGRARRPPPPDGSTVGHRRRDRRPQHGRRDRRQRPRPGAIVALVGPPGVGKTSLGESVARALGRKFTRVALGGVRDEAEIRGHRRTYVGAQPGRIVRAMTEAGTMNPVFLLDEIDKVGSDWRGDPSSALLEVLDPAQNHSFRDHYLEVDLDLSEVLFIATANVLDTIPGPLLDRMEVIRLDGYTDDEKVAIARDHLLPASRPATACGTARSRSPTRRCARSSTATPGRPACGTWSASSASCCARRPPSGPGGRDAHRHRPGGCAPYLGRPRFHDEAADRTRSRRGHRPGRDRCRRRRALRRGHLHAGRAGLTLTGQLGDVMKESAQIALSYVRSRADRLGIDQAALDAGGSTSTSPRARCPRTARRRASPWPPRWSACCGRRCGPPGHDRRGHAEGQVLPIGGLKQKLLAAHRAGLARSSCRGATSPTWTTCPRPCGPG